MDFSDPPRPARSENLLPMINVVFLLLIFFLIAARLAGPEPFPVTVPEAESDMLAEDGFTLWLGPGGEAGFADAPGDEAVEALAAARAAHCATADCVAEPPVLLLRADADAPAAALAALMPALGAMGFARVGMVTLPR